jgi:serine/threonine protein kinase
MAPEQADLKAVPDARWDVYALGAILYCMLVGKPPHMSEELLRRIEAAPDLPGRLLRYRQWITSHKPPDEHRKVPGVDRALAGIVDRCLAPRPSRRFANVQEVLDAWTRDHVKLDGPCCCWASWAAAAAPGHTAAGCIRRVKSRPMR